MFRKNKSGYARGNADTIGILALIAIIAIAIIGMMWGIPKYRIYKQTMKGQAELREAEWTKKIQIEEARGKLEAANMLAQARVTQAEAEGAAEVARATKTAEANLILGESLKGNDAYLRYLWIMSIRDGAGERIYIPTEAGLPLLEARSPTVIPVEGH